MDDVTAGAASSPSRLPSDAATIADLVAFCRSRTVPELTGMPAPWDCLADELRRTGLAGPGPDPAEVLASADRRLLDREVPADVAARVVATLGVRYQAKDGYLYGLNNAALPLSAVEAFEISDLKTIIRAVGRGSYNRTIPIPGQRGRRIVRRIRRSGKVLAAVLVSPVFIPLLAIGFAAGRISAKPANRPAGIPRRSQPDRVPIRRRTAGIRQAGTGRKLDHHLLNDTAARLGLDQGRVLARHITPGDATSCLEIISLWSSLRPVALPALSHGIFRAGYQLTSRPRQQPYQWSRGDISVRVTACLPGDQLAGTNTVVPPDTTGFRIVLAVQHSADTYTSAPPQGRLALTRLVTNRQLESAALRTATAWVPAVAVGAWFAQWALQIPPHGPLGRWVALLLTGSFATVALVPVYFLMLGLAMDASPFHAEAAHRPVLRFIRYFGMWSYYMLLSILVCDGALLALIWLARLAFKQGAHLF